MDIDALTNLCNFVLGMFFSSCCDTSKYFWLLCEITVACLRSTYASGKEQQHTEAVLMSQQYAKWISCYSYRYSYRIFHFHETKSLELVFFFFFYIVRG